MISILITFIFIENFPETRKHYNYAFVGHSHVACSVNPELLKKTGKSLIVKGVHGQSLFWTVKAAEKLIKKNKVDNLFISYTNNSLTTDYWTFEDSRIEKSNNIYQLDLNDLNYFVETKPSNLFKNYLKFSYPLGELTGGFNASKGNYISKEKSNFGFRIKQQFSIIDDYKDKMGFKELFEFCLNNPNLRIILIRFPLSKSFFEILKGSTNEELYLQSVAYLTRLSNVIWCDYAFSIEDESLFLNVDHLNLEGAETFSNKLALDVKKYSYLKHR